MVNSLLNIPTAYKGFKDVPVSGISLTVDAPEADGTMPYLQVKFSVTNTSDRNWSGFSSQLILLNANGKILNKEEDSSGTECAAGETVELEVTMYRRMNINDFEGKPEKARLVICVVGCAGDQVTLDKFTVSDDSDVVFAFKPQKIGPYVELAGGSFLKATNSETDEVQWDVMALFQNNSDLHIPQARLVGSLLDKAGKGIGQIDDYGPLTAGGFYKASRDDSVKSKKWKGATMEFMFEIFSPVAVGRVEHVGMTIG